MTRRIAVLIPAISSLLIMGLALPTFAGDSEPLSKAGLISKWGKPKVTMKMKSPAFTESGIRFDESLSYYIDFEDGHCVTLTVHFYQGKLVDVDYDTKLAEGEGESEPEEGSKDELIRT